MFKAIDLKNADKELPPFAKKICNGCGLFVVLFLLGSGLWHWLEKLIR